MTLPVIKSATNLPAETNCRILSKTVRHESLGKRLESFREQKKLEGFTPFDREEYMKLPDLSDPKWEKVISGVEVPAVEFLATKVLLSKLTLEYKKDSSPAKTQNSVQELRAFFEKNFNLLKVQADLKKIFGERV